LKTIKKIQVYPVKIRILAPLLWPSKPCQLTLHHSKGILRYPPISSSMVLVSQ
jgi:hypothetical protein